MMVKRVIVISIILSLLYPIIVFADIQSRFDSIRKQSTYWMPYYDKDTKLIIIINKKEWLMNLNEVALIAKVMRRCKDDTNNIPRQYWWFEEGDLEGLVTKNWDTMYNIKYPADLNDLMLDAKKKARNLLK